MYKIEKCQTGTENQTLTENQTQAEHKILKVKAIDQTQLKNNILVKNLSKAVAGAVKAEEKEEMLPL